MRKFSRLLFVFLFHNLCALSLIIFSWLKAEVYFYLWRCICCFFRNDVLPDCTSKWWMHPSSSRYENLWKGVRNCKYSWWKWTQEVSVCQFWLGVSSALWLGFRITRRMNFVVVVHFVVSFFFVWLFVVLLDPWLCGQHHKTLQFAIHISFSCNVAICH